ncbi:MAG: RNA polymerase sigma factor RpoD, partial [Deltaproteobacteria bacterium]|nr:RNA polymerase sigma factor RpoD [Deltaproteobacteria bacterium]
MAKEGEMEKLKQLINMGKEKGYLTYDEVNDLLPPDIVSSDQIDDLMMMFGEMDIEVVDVAHKAAVTKQQEEVERLPSEEEVELEAEGLAKSIDPVYMYLREMGSVSLLTREGEVEIAKRIERGKKAVMRGIARTPMAAQEVIRLGERLRAGELGVRDVVVFNEEEMTEEKV